MNCQETEHKLLKMTAHIPLTEKQRKVLAIKLLPECVNMTEVQKAETAGVSERYYYDLLNNPEFNAILAKEARKLISRQVPECTNTYLKVAKNGDRQALERVLEQTGVLDPPQRNVNVRGSIVKADLGELLALIKEQQIDSEDISDVVDVIEEEIAALRGVEGSTVGEGEVPGIPKENIGPSLSENLKNEDEG